MQIHRYVIVFDTADIGAESAFWAGLLGGTLVADNGRHSVIVDGEWSTYRTESSPRGR